MVRKVMNLPTAGWPISYTIIIVMMMMMTTTTTTMMMMMKMMIIIIITIIELVSNLYYSAG